MKGLSYCLTVLAALSFWALGSAAVYAATDEGVAVAIVYDTSGSMRDSVANETGQATPKYLIANRALQAVTRQLAAFTTNSAGAARRVEAGLFVFEGDSARQAVRFGALDPVAIDKWARDFKSPNGNTPLGNALSLATQAVLASPLSRKHVLILTDGENTAGPTPAAVLPGLKKKFEQAGKSFSVHFVAFDVSARVFDGVKKQGATVVSAANEKQLNSQLDFILQQKILLEDEERK
jgi:Mg-chelatase subunit ChlD